MALGILDIHTQKIETRLLSLTLCAKINSKWINDVNLNPENLRSSEESIGETPEDIGIGNDFPDRIPIAQNTKAKFDKLSSINLKSFCTGTREKVSLRRINLECNTYVHESNARNLPV
jgi:hypothetical protein